VRQDARESSFVGQTFLPRVPCPKEGSGFFALVLGSLARRDARESSFVGRAFLPPRSRAPEEGSGSFA
jgi:hypothetical protein